MRKILMNFYLNPRGQTMRRVCILTLSMMFLVFYLPLSAQQTAVNGRVRDANTGETLPGVTVQVMGSTSGTITGMDGSFSLNLSSDNATLIFSFIGYQTQEINVEGRSMLEVEMVEDMMALDEVVVTGYATQKKSTLTGAVVPLNIDDIQSVTDASVASRLQGRVAGVTITTNNAPGGEATVRIRGIGSINNNDPLYIIDGVPVTTGLSGINPNDVISMSVLKDASSSAIYGSRAANGVIIVTTNRGKKESQSMSFQYRGGIQRATNKLDLCDTQEYGDLLWLEFKNEGLVVGDPGWGHLQYGSGEYPVIPDYILPNGAMEGEVDETLYSYPFPYNGITKANKTGTDWYDEIFEVAPVQEYNLTISGGSQNGTYSVSGGYLNQKGIIKYSGFERFSLRANTDLNVSDWLQIGESLGVTYSNYIGSSISGGEGGAVANASRVPAIVPVYDIMGNFAGNKIPVLGNWDNPVASLTRNKDDYRKDLRVLANFYAQINLTDDLYFKSLLGVDFSNSRTRNRSLISPEMNQSNEFSSLEERYAGIFQYNWTNTLSYTKTFSDNHHFNLLLGSEVVDNTNENFSATRTNFGWETVDFMILDAGTADQLNSGSESRWALFSYFGRINYDYKGKYLIEGVLRRDGSSRFIEENRWATFPAFSAGWKISEESFMDGFSWLNNLKLRLGWGKNGNDNVGNYNGYSIYRSNGEESYYNISGSSKTSSTPGYYQYSIGNSDAKWEATTTVNLGVDFAILNNKLEFNVDIYDRLTSDMLYPDSRPGTWGYVQLPNVNIGEMRNRGIDVVSTYRGSIGKDFSYSVRGNISHYKNEVLKLNENEKEIYYGSNLRDEVYTATKSGVPISSFYGYVVEGYFNTQEEIDAHPKYNPDINGVDTYSRLGVFKYKDVNEDGVITPDDRTFIGSPHPDLTYGIDLDFNYRNWSLSTFFQGVYGNELTNYIDRWVMFNFFEGNRKTRRLNESWTQERYESGAKITAPIALLDDATMQKQSSYFIEDGSYFRLKSLQIGYALPSQVISKLKIEGLSLLFEMSNVFTISKYGGLDPEVPLTNTVTMGVDQGVYPTPQNIMFTIRLDI